MGTPNEIKVWDPLVRISHWVIVLAFFFAYFVHEDEQIELHAWAGYVVLVLVLIRVVWGFIGPRYARFSDFVRRPSVVFAHLRDLYHGRGPRYIGHTPAGGAMILALLVLLLLIGGTGLVLYGIEEHAGPLAAYVADVDEAWEDVLEEAHEVLANLTLVLVALHVIGVVWEGLIHHENLVRSMFTGRKRA